MSVINQVLLDLEKRRASSAERGAVPNHVRALPEDVRQVPWAWIAGAMGAVVIVVAAWALLAGSSMNRGAPAARSSAEVAIERVVTASAGVASSEKLVAAAEPASRLSFELSSVPGGAQPQRGESPASVERVAAPVPTARVISQADPVPASREAPTVERPKIRPERTESEKPAPDKPETRPEISKQVKQPTARELAENEYRKATVSLNQGRMAEAQQEFEAALNLYPAYPAARQALVGVLVETKKLADAERVLQDGLALAPAQTGFAMALARLQVERGDAAQGAATLKKSLEYAQGNAEYAAFLAALLQRQGRHEEAIEQFQAALRVKPAVGVWWLGLGISLQAANRVADAQEAFRRARATNNLSPELAAFADQRLKQLQ